MYTSHFLFGVANKNPRIRSTSKGLNTSPVIVGASDWRSMKSKQTGMLAKTRGGVSCSITDETARNILLKHIQYEQQKKAPETWAMYRTYQVNTHATLEKATCSLHSMRSMK
jgi:hypothetical protein